MSPTAPDPIVTLARARADARARRDWGEADRLRQEIEAAGWKVIDAGLSFTLAPAHPPDVVVDGRVRHGTSASVPSRLEEAPVGVATVVILASEEAAAIGSGIAAVRAAVPAGVTLAVVGDAPTPAVEAALVAAASGAGGDAGPPLEVVLTSERLGIAAAANAGIRRATAPVVVLLGAARAPTGDVVTPLVRALEDPGVAVAGAAGITTAELRHLRAAGPGDVDAVTFDCLAFRREDYRARGPLDERLRTAAYLAAWWGLVLRDEGAWSPPRRAVALADLPLRPAAADGQGVEDAAGMNERAVRRDYYRVLERFGGRADLLGKAGSGPGRRDP